MDKVNITSSILPYFSVCSIILISRLHTARYCASSSDILFFCHDMHDAVHTPPSRIIPTSLTITILPLYPYALLITCPYRFNLSFQHFLGHFCRFRCLCISFVSYSLQLCDYALHYNFPHSRHTPIARELSK